MSDEALVERVAERWEAMKRPGGYVDRDDLIHAVIEEVADAVEEEAAQMDLTDAFLGWADVVTWLREQAGEEGAVSEDDWVEETMRLVTRYAKLYSRYVHPDGSYGPSEELVDRLERAESALLGRLQAAEGRAWTWANVNGWLADRGHEARRLAGPDSSAIEKVVDPNRTDQMTDQTQPREATMDDRVEDILHVLRFTRDTHARNSPRWRQWDKRAEAVEEMYDRLQAAEERVEQMRSALQKIRFWSSPENDEATEGDTVAKMWHAAREALREGEG